MSATRSNVCFFTPNTTQYFVVLNAGDETRLSPLFTAVAGGFAANLVRNENQRHSTILKSAGQIPIGFSHSMAPAPVSRHSNYA